MTESSSPPTEASADDEPAPAEPPPPVPRGMRRVARARRDADHHNTIELAPPFALSC